MLSPKIHIFIAVFCLMCVPYPAGAIEAIDRLQNGYTVTADSHGLAIRNTDLRPVAQQAGQFEQLDIRSVDHENTLTLISVVDDATNAVRNFLWNGENISPLSTIEDKQSGIDGICLYKSIDDQLLYAFLIKDDSPIEQRLIYDLKSQRPLDRSVRHIPASHGVSSCAANDKAGHLYVAEESFGVWRYDANTESELSRELIDAQMPFGTLTGEIKSIDVTANGLLAVSQPETDGIRIIRAAKGQAPYPSRSHTLNVSGIAAISIFQEQNHTRLLYAHKGIKSVTLKTKSEIAPSQQRFTQVQATTETTPVKKLGDAADDPAIWINQRSPNKSLILGTDKQSGLAVYGVDGKQRQFIASGRVNNVDIRNNVKLGHKSKHIAAASNRDNNSITLYEIQPRSGKVIPLSDIPTTLDEVYGLCMYRQASSGMGYVFINDKDGRYQQYQLTYENKRIKGKLVRAFKLPNQPEGCVADDNTDNLFVGVEDQGIWLTSALPNHHDTPQKILSVGKHLYADVEGLALYQNNEHNYLVASSQGNNSYVLFNATAPYAHVGTFKITINNETFIDGASETDGLDVTSVSLNQDYPEGLLVVQDGRNVLPQEPQNFKLVSFKMIFDKLGL